MPNPEFQEVQQTDFSFPSFGSFPQPSQPIALIEPLKKPKKRKERKERKERHMEQTEELQDLDYYIDKKGDWSWLEYQAIRNHPVPEYTRTTSKILDSSFKIVETNRYNQVIVHKPTRKQERLCYSELKKVMKEYHVVMNAHRNPVPGTWSDYVPLPNLDFIGQEPIRSTWEDEFQQKNSLADKNIRRDPTNAQAWIEFVKLQDELLLHDTSSATRTRVQSKKLGILEKSLEDLSNNEELVEMYMDLLQETRDSREMLVKWDQVLKYHPCSFLLWKKYLDYRVTNPGSFQLDLVLQLHSECLHSLSQSQHNRDEYMLHIFGRVCVLLKQMGYIEQAIGCYQALIEFNCYCPMNVKQLNLYQKMEEFRDFWDWECPRFGENGAPGWEKCQGKTRSDFQDIEMDTEGFEDVEDGFQRWFQKESFVSQNQWMPLRNTTQEVFDDPFQVVLFDDIKPFLFEIRSQSKKIQLVDQFLEFLGLPIKQNQGSMQSRDMFLMEELIEKPLMDRFLEREDVVSIQCPLRYSPQRVDSLYGDDQYWPCSIGPSQLSVIERARPYNLDLIKQILAQAKVLFPSAKHYNCYILWIEFLKEPNATERIAKRMLKIEPNDLLLWNMYAQIVLRLKGVEESIKVYKTILQMYSMFPKQHQIGSTKLHCHLAELEWANGNSKSAKVALLQLMDLKILEPTGPVLLKGRKWFQAQIDQSITSIQDQNVYTLPMDYLVSVTFAASFLELLCQSIDSAIDLFLAVIKKSTPQSLLAELLYEQATKLVCLSIKISNISKLSTLRDLLEKALHSFPHNTLFLTLYGWNEGSTKIDNRVRRFLNEKMKINPSPILTFFSVWTELHQRSNSSVQVVRYTLQDSFYSKSNKGSLQTWILAIEFEARYGELKRAKALLFQAIASCPWSKDLYMLAFAILKPEFSPQELQDLYTLMEEREIRIYQPLDII